MQARMAPDQTFRVHPSLKAFLIPPPDFLARHFAHGNASRDSNRPPAPTFLATGAIVFDRQPGSAQAGSPSPKVLLIQRAAHDSTPLTWESPGGGCDDDDPSVLYSCVRELREEAGLEAVSIGPLIRCPASNDTTAESGPGEGEAEWGEKMGGQFFLTRKGKPVCKFYFIVETSQTSDVVVDPNEHAAYIWATEEEVKEGTTKGSEGENGMQLTFTSTEQRRVLLEAFKALTNKHSG